MKAATTLFTLFFVASINLHVVFYAPTYVGQMSSSYRTVNLYTHI